MMTTEEEDLADWIEGVIRQADPDDWVQAQAAPDPTCYMLQEAADELGVNTETMRAWIKQGKVQATRASKRWEIPAAEVERLYLERSFPPVVRPTNDGLEIRLRQRPSDPIRVKAAPKGRTGAHGQSRGAQEPNVRRKRSSP